MLVEWEFGMRSSHVQLETPFLASPSSPLSLFLSPQSVFGVQGGVNVSPGILDRWRLVYPKVTHTLPVLDSYDRNAFLRGL